MDLTTVLIGCRDVRMALELIQVATMREETTWAPSAIVLKLNTPILISTSEPNKQLI